MATYCYSTLFATTQHSVGGINQVRPCLRPYWGLVDSCLHSMERGIWPQVATEGSQSSCDPAVSRWHICDDSCRSQGTCMVPHTTNRISAGCLESGANGMLPPPPPPPNWGRDWGLSTPHGHWYDGWSCEQQKRQTLCLMFVAVKVCTYSDRLSILQSESGAATAWRQNVWSYSHQRWTRPLCDYVEE